VFGKVKASIFTRKKPQEQTTNQNAKAQNKQLSQNIYPRHCGAADQPSN
jgi:hypothetical protein